MLTPFPGTILHSIEKQNKWIEDENYANYDMVDAITPTETLSSDEIREELYKCYRNFYGMSYRRIIGIFSRNPIERKIYRYSALQSVMQKIRCRK